MAKKKTTKSVKSKSSNTKGKDKMPKEEKIQASVEKIGEDQIDSERQFDDFAHDTYFDKFCFAMELIGAGFETDTTFEMVVALVEVLSMVTSEIAMPVDHLQKMVADIRELHDASHDKDCPCHHEDSTDSESN
jgi:hypothetical protein